MRVRSNYGVIGPQITPSSFTTGGVYQADDQRILKSIGNWANTYFPTSYISVINNFTGTKIYVDGIAGNDSGLGSASNPYSTMDKAMTVRNTLTTSNVMIIVGAGTYAMTPSVSGQGSYILNDISNTFSTVVVCAPGKVILTWNAGAARDAGVVSFKSTNSAVYGAIFQRDNNGKTVNYSTAFCNSQSTAQLGPYYNCVFQETNANNNWSLVYNNSNTVSGTVNYCTFAVNKSALGDYSSGANQVFNNCLYNWTYTSTGAGTSTQNNPVILSSHDLDFTTYKSTSAAGSGVYYGTYAWPTS